MTVARSLFRTLAVAAALLVAAAPTQAQGFLDRGNGKFLAPFKQVIAPAGDSTVRVRADDREVALGTAVSPTGLVLTKASELKGKVSVRLRDGTEYDATIVGVHKPTDLALLSIDATLKPVEFADSKKAPVGNWLAASGPASDPVGIGIVSVATRRLRGEDATLYENKNKGYLGVGLRNDDEQAGARVTFLSPTGPAIKAGLRENDLIYEISGKEVSGEKNLRETLEEYQPGDSVTLRVKRGESDLKIKVTLVSSSKINRGELQNHLGGDLSGRRTGFPSILQTDMVIEPKNCGGPVVDLDGKVLGVAIARAGRVETWVLPSEEIRPVLKELKEGKHRPVSSTVSSSK